jgi:CheY-like chemotaxis protein
VAKILVADDNSNIQKMVGLALKDQGIDVVAVGNGEAAVRKISDVRPDLVLADVFMPVRNGYEVCRYVKEDSKLSHIPVILLVGAFDPLDEQEAQRAGADGVLKKPFVPPDPLISMVKSALARAGVSIGTTPPEEKIPEVAPRALSEILKPGLSSKLAGLTKDKLPDAEPEPLPEEFPATPAQVQFPAGQEPVAFGSLLETSAVEDDSAFLPKPLAEERDWGAESDEVEEELEGEDESPRSAWRPGGLEERLEEIAGSSHGVPDWRDQAFHGSSPSADAHSTSWIPAAETSQIAETTAVAVTTAETKPTNTPTPFSGDAWAAAMAAGVEEKLAKVEEPIAEAPAAQTEVRKPENAKVAEVSGGSSLPEAAHEPVVMQETANSWFSVSSSPWESEAQKASLLAATWDTPTAEPHAETAAPEPAMTEIVHEEAAHETATSYYSAEPPVEPVDDLNLENETGYGSEIEAATAAHEESLLNETQEVPVYETPAPWAAPEPPQEAPARVEEAPALAEEAAAPPAEAKEPNMDELVARVLEKMNPEVMQKVTREILKPVIEAIIQNELTKKS